MKNHLTIVIPTFNRYKRLLRLLQYFESYNFPAKIRVLDSSSHENVSSDLQSLLKSENIDYFKYPHIISPTEKISEGVKDISTPYSLFCADDDFTTPLGMKACVEFLESNPDYSSVQGRNIIFWIKNGDLHNVAAKYFYGRNLDINGNNPDERMVQQFSLYKPQFYAVHRTKTMQIFSEIMQSAKLTAYNLALICELLLPYISVIFGKHKVLPIFYCAREHTTTLNSPKKFDSEDDIAKDPKFVDLPSVEMIAKDPQYVNEYSRFIESLTLLLADVHGSDKNEARSQILAGMDAYMNVFVPRFKNGMLQMNASIEECKDELGYPFFNNTEAIEEWRRMEFFIKKSLSPNNEQGSNAPALNQLGLELLNKGDKQGALNAFLKSLESDPNFATGYQNAGILYLQAGEANKAFQYFVKSLEVAPGDRNIALNTAKFLRTLKIQSS